MIQSEVSQFEELLEFDMLFIFLTRIDTTKIICQNGGGVLSHFNENNGSTGYFAAHHLS